MFLAEDLQRLFAFGLIGLLIECFFTGAKNLLKGDLHARCHTHLSVLPLYSTAGFLLETVHSNIHLPIIYMGFLYMCIIYAVEFSFGAVYKWLTGECPWEYKSNTSILGFIEIQYFPYWYCVGLGFNYISGFLHKIVHLINTIQ